MQLVTGRFAECVVDCVLAEADFAPPMQWMAAMMQGDPLGEVAPILCQESDTVN